MTVRRWSAVAAPIVLWLLATMVARVEGFTMAIPWWDWHLLDARPLLEHPLGSLCHLHSQPPVLNALLAGVLWASRAIGTDPTVIAGAVFASLGVLACVVFHRTVLDLTGSSALAVAGLLLVIAGPGYHVLANLFFYEFLVHVLLLLILAASVQYLKHGDEPRLVGVALLLVTLTLTRTLFHPAWAGGFLAVLVGLRARLVSWRTVGRVWWVFLALLALLAVWPMKNLVVSGRFFSASMSSFSVATISRDCLEPIVSGYVTPEALAAEERVRGERALAACGPQGSEVLLESRKGDGSPNWNHVGRLARVPAWDACVRTHVRSHPERVLVRAAAQYAMWTRASFIDPHHGFVMGPPSSTYQAWARFVNDILFADLRPAIEDRWPDWSVHRYAVTLRNRPVPYSLFGVIVLPSVLVALSLAGLRHSRELGGAAALLVLAIVVPPMVAVCLTDGQEGGRMRFAAMPVLVIGCCWLVRTLYRRDAS